MFKTDLNFNHFEVTKVTLAKAFELKISILRVKL